ncbi:hypothetical protein NQ314_006656 [Rhamnusium bicolor]|uniref:Uncharacterized protein n=1 Tax=Rhamnusium bicolor TaxID=1586634 RepID=A0AAV8Z087_9CUCU|nr:hypothetical protein NQ314_006656 [Rhamnusium bicolor]
MPKTSSWIKNVTELELNGDKVFCKACAKIGRKKTNKKQKEQGFMQKILPMMVIPFMVSTSMIPMMLISLKFMLLKSALIGKIAILLLIINMFRRRDNGGGVFTHNLNAGNDVAMDHYGYHGDEEYGAYINRRRKRNFS